MKQNEKEVRQKIKQANNCYVYSMLDGVDVGHYFKTTKSDVWYWTRKYIRMTKKNPPPYDDLTNLNNTFVLREDGDLYIH
jgi:hypothetical protein|tara:strand:+ start:48 stop:287 length:240 start_codon:yes stop_codon:yes gene_type:complete